MAANLVPASLYDEARRRLGGMHPAWMTASDQDIYDQVLKNQTLFAQSDPIRLAVQAAAYSSSQQPYDATYLAQVTPWLVQQGYANAASMSPAEQTALHRQLSGTAPASPTPTAPTVTTRSPGQSDADILRVLQGNPQITPGATPEERWRQWAQLIGAPNAAYTPDTTTPEGQRQAYMAALPPVNKIVGRNFLRFDPETRDFMLSAYEARGTSENEVLNSVVKQLPGAFAFGGPATPFGTVKR